MKDWLIEMIDQVALGELLAKSSVSCGQRFGLIAVDNAVEFMLIAYVEVHKQIVGGYKAGGIPKKAWDETKREFPKLLTFVVTQEPNLQPLEIEISRYHDFRNTLYHSGTPVTTSPGRVTRYSELAREVLSILFAIQFSADEWNEILARIGSFFTGSSIDKSIKRAVSYEEAEGLVKFTTTDFPTAAEAIAICLYGFTIVTGAPPSRPALVKSLAKSGHPLSADVVKSRLSDLRKVGWVRKNDLLAAKGRKELAKKYLISS